MHWGTGQDAGNDKAVPGRTTVRVHRGSRVPLRRQLVAQVGALVRCGRCRPGERLPGARRLAADLGVHRHTVSAAYGELAREGLLETSPGKGYRVRPAAGRCGGGPDAAFRGLLADARRAGLGTAALARRCGSWLRRLRGGAVALVAASEPTRRLWRRELVTQGLEVTLHESAPAGIARLVGQHPVGLVLATLDLVERLGSILPPSVEVWAARSPDRQDVRARLEELPAGSVVLTASVSPALRREVREIAAALRGPELAVREGGSPGTPRLDGKLDLADLVLADAVLARGLAEQAGRARVVRLETLSPGCVRRVGAWVRAGREPALAASDLLQQESGRG